MLCANATDPDKTSSLEYSIVAGSVQGFDENGRIVNATSTGVKVCSVLHYYSQIVLDSLS